MADHQNDHLPATPSSSKAVAEFIQQAGKLPANISMGDKGRLIFALDATASREATWDRACHLQGRMFTETKALGQLAVQLCYYRGFSQFHASPWLHSTEALLAEMNQVSCIGGYTQISRLLQHGLSEAKQQPLHGIVFVGDSLEESIDELCNWAGQLKLHGVPVFLFQEGYDEVTTQGYRQIAQVSGGAHCQFDEGSAAGLQALLSAVAVYSVGGLTALQHFAKGQPEIVLQLEHQLSGT